MKPKTFAEALTQRLREDPTARAKLVSAGMRPGVIEYLCSPAEESIVATHAKTVKATLGIDASAFTFMQAKRELWSEGDRLPDIPSRQELGKAVLALLDVYPAHRLCMSVGLTEARPLRIACGAHASPRLKTVKAMLIALWTHRETGTLPEPIQAKSVEPKPKLAWNPWFRLRMLAQDDPAHYSSTAVGNRIGVKDRSVRARWKGKQKVSLNDVYTRRLLEAYPELIADMPAVPEPVPLPPLPDATLPAVREIPMSPSLVSAALASLHASVEMLRAIGETNVLVDGDRLNVLKELRRLLEGVRFDRGMLTRLQSEVPVTEQDNILFNIVRGLASRRKAR